MKKINICMMVALMVSGLHLYGQEFSMEYTTELQTNFGNSNFVNLLCLNGELALKKSFSIEASTISIAKTNGERLVDDMQIFSNIEEENLPFAFSVCDIKFSLNNYHTLYLGIRNMNEDYFTTPVTSFFTNSSCGVFPTIGANYPIANYPVASVGVHYKYSTEKINVQTSLYNGKGYNRFSGKDNIFRFYPKEDGIFVVNEVLYRNKESRYSIGNALYYNKSFSASPWFYVEQGVGRKIVLLAGYSHAFSAGAECTDFAGFGLHYALKKSEFGIFTDYANFREQSEISTELTCLFPVAEHVYVQPVSHFIVTGHTLNTICCLRLGMLM